MTTAVIGSGGIGSAIARLLASGGESLRLSSADYQTAEKLAGQIGRAAVAVADNREALQGAEAVVLALRFTVLEACHQRDRRPGDPQARRGSEQPGRPRRRRQASYVSCRRGQSSGEVVAGWLPAGTRLAMAFGSMSADLLESSSNRSPEPAVLFYVTDDNRAGKDVERLIRTAGFEPMKVGGIDQSSRLEVGGDLHDLVVDSAQGQALLFGRHSDATE